MIRLAGAVAAILCSGAHACGDAGDTLAKGEQYVVAWRTAAAPLATDRHFAIDITICPLGQAPLPRAVRVDARMPEHRHGMNYKPTIVATGAGRYRAEGLLFHMGGRWEIAFDVVAGSTTERITSDVVLE